MVSSPSRARAQAPAAESPAPLNARLAARDHAVLAAASDPIITIDSYGRIESASDSVQRVFGWLPNELVGRNISVLMPEPHRSAHDGHMANYRRTGRSMVVGRTCEFEAVRRNGECFPIELSVARVDRAGDEMPLFVGSVRDLTERKKMERGLRLVKELALSISRTASLSEALVETLHLVCVATGWDYGEAWMAEDDGKELSGRACWIRPDCGLERFASTVSTVRFPLGVGLPGRAWHSAQPVWAGDLRILVAPEFCRPKVAREVGLRAAAAVPVLAEDKPIAVLVFFARSVRRKDAHLLDLVGAAVAPLGTLIQRKRAEDDLNEYRHRLEEMVETRTRALQESHARLRMADRMASLGTLAAGLGHDMNNVLLPMRAHLNVLAAASGAEPNSVGVQLKRFQLGVAYLQQLADGLHGLAVDPERTEATGEATALHAWWEQTGALLRKAVPKHVRVITSLPKLLPAVAIRPHALTQAVLNLIVNAGEAIPPPRQRRRRQGYVRLTAELLPDESAVRLSVADNGCGMSDEVRRRAAEMFFTTKSRGLGTGLGLAMVRSVAERAGGSATIESTLGSGTTVSLVLPVAKPDSGRAEPTASVRVADGRIASLIRSLLEVSGAQTSVGAESAEADILVVDPSAASLAKCRHWRKARPEGRLVVVGTPPPRTVRAWRALKPNLIEDPSDFGAIQTALGAIAQ